MNRTILTRWSSICVLIFIGMGFNSVNGEESLTELRKQTRKLLTCEATAQGSDTKLTATYELCDLYVVLRSDNRYADSPMLRGDAAQLRKRLLRISQRMESKLKRAKILPPDDLEHRVNNSLARLGDPSPASVEYELQNAAGGGAVVDDAWGLVELIQRVIAPDFWDSQGGPGVIRYFAIRRALVVRATTDVHEQLRELLTALR